MNFVNNVHTFLRYSSAAIRSVLKPTIPPYVIYFVTSRCNARCGFCHFKAQIENPARIERELSLKEIECISKKFGRIIKLSLCGGEPFIREDIDQIVDIWIRNTKPLIVDIPTNSSLPEKIREKCASILRSHPKVTIDIQLSLEGDEQIHDEVRKFPGIYQRVMKTYEYLVELRKMYSNLKIKLNLVYIPENESAVLKLMRHFTHCYEFDRVQITFPHGNNIADTHINHLNFNRFYKLTRTVLKSRVLSRFDLHTMIFRSIKLTRDELLLDANNKCSMGSYCNSGKSFIVIDDEGAVFPCEPLWDSVGNLRDHDYDITKILKSKRMKEFWQTHHGNQKCHCLWGCAALGSIIQRPRYIPKNLYYFAYLFMTGGKCDNRSESKGVSHEDFS